jgi:hypothetical protein
MFFMYFIHGYHCCQWVEKSSPFTRMKENVPDYRRGARDPDTARADATPPGPTFS